MADFPALPLFTDAYLADCQHLTDEEHGRYLLLLMTMWRTPECRLPNDDEWLARKFRRSTADIVSQFRPLIREFCQCSGNWIMQKRLTREMEYVRKKSKARSDSAKSRWNKGKGECIRNAPTPTPTPTISEEDKSSSGARAPSSPSAQSPTPEPERDLFGETPATVPVEPAKAPPPRTLEQQIFDLGREIIPGKNPGGQVTRLKRHFDGDLERTLQALKLAATKSDPPAYIGAIIRGEPAARAESVLEETDRLYRSLGVL